MSDKKRDKGEGGGGGEEEEGGREERREGWGGDMPVECVALCFRDSPARRVEQHQAFDWLNLSS